jgi:hypothetical protein
MCHLCPPIDTEDDPNRPTRAEAEADQRAADARPWWQQPGDTVFTANASDGLLVRLAIRRLAVGTQLHLGDRVVTTLTVCASNTVRIWHGVSLRRWLIDLLYHIR